MFLVTYGFSVPFTAYPDILRKDNAAGGVDITPAYADNMLLVPLVPLTGGISFLHPRTSGCSRAETGKRLDKWIAKPNLILGA